MTAPIRVRFAPSPTGYLHIGGARTAMYNYLWAKARGGKYILRIEDTDTDRSSSEYEKLQIEDLKWLGITHDEGPDVGGDFGPYRQSERLPIYKEWAEKLIAEKKAFYCFCTEEELNAKKEAANLENRAPIYDGKCRHLTDSETKNLFSLGKEAVIRFHVPHKAYVFHDIVRGQVAFPEGMVGDFVIMRANGIPVYNFAVVVDDLLMKITHVIRGEEHLPNTLRQLMLYEAFKATPPEFAHASLLIGEDRQKLSKRHGATSVRLYKDEGYLPQALLNYLLLLGWSHPEEKDVFDVHTLGAVFDIKRLTKAPAIYDIAKLGYINGQHLRILPLEQILVAVEKVMPKDHSFFKMDRDWRLKSLIVFKDKINFFPEIIPHYEVLFGLEEKDETPDYKEAKTWSTIPIIRHYLKGEIDKLIAQGKSFATEADCQTWSEHIKKELKIKGKELFMGMRAVLTLSAHGPELKLIIPLTPLSTLKRRME